MDGLTVIQVFAFLVIFGSLCFAAGLSHAVRGIRAPLRSTSMATPVRLSLAASWIEAGLIDLAKVDPRTEILFGEWCYDTISEMSDRGCSRWEIAEVIRDHSLTLEEGVDGLPLRGEEEKGGHKDVGQHAPIRINLTGYHKN